MTTTMTLTIETRPYLGGVLALASDSTGRHVARAFSSTTRRALRLLRARVEWQYGPAAAAAICKGVVQS